MGKLILKKSLYLADSHLDAGAFSERLTLKTKIQSTSVQRLAIIQIVLFSLLSTNLLLAQEICTDGIDNDGDGFIDYFDDDCACDELLFNAQCEEGCEIYSDPSDSIRMRLKWSSGVINYGDDMQAHRPNLTVDGYGSEIYVGGEALINGTETNGIITINSTDGAFKNFHAGDNTTSMKWAHITIGDVDHDMNVDFFRANSDLGLSRYSNDGTEIWRYDSALSRPRYPKLGDIDQDGVAEVYVGSRILNAVTGELLFSRTGSSGCNPQTSLGSCITVSSIMGDFTASDGLELACGDIVYEFDTWSASGLNTPNTIQAPAPVLDGITGFADVNNDGKNDVIVVRSNLDQGAVWVWNADDEVIIATGPSGENGGRPLVTDLDNNCLADIIVVFRNELVIYEYDGSPDLLVKRRIPIADNSGYTGCTAFDLNQDGILEIIHRDQETLRIIDGVTLDVIDSYQIYSVTGFESPIVADINGDGQAEILTSGYTNLSSPDSVKVFCFESANKPWAPARRVWNQTGYHVTNVNDDLTIPRYQQNSAAFFDTDSCLIETCPQVYNNFGMQAAYRTQQGCLVYPNKPDLTLSIIDFSCEGDSTIYCLDIEQLSDIELATDCISFAWYFDSLHVNALQDTFTFCFDRDGSGRLILDSIKIKIPTFTNGYHQIYFTVNDVGILPGDWNYESTNILECDYANNVDSIEFVDIACLSPYTRVLDDSCTYTVSLDTTLVWEGCSTPFTLAILYDSLGTWVPYDGTTLTSAGIYRLEVTADSGGTCWTTVTIVDPFAPPAVDLGPDIIRCTSEPIVLTAPSGPYDYVWSDFSTDSTFTTADDGQYIVEVIGQCGASSSDTIIISTDTANQVSIISPTTFCLGAELSLNIDMTVDSLDWYIDDELVCADCLSLDVVADHSYSVAVLTWLGDCFSADTISLVPIPPLLDTLQFQICEGDSIMLGDKWIFSDLDTSIIYQAANGCDSTIQYDVTFADFAFQDTMIAICEGDSMLISGTWYTAPVTIMDTMLTASCPLITTTILSTITSDTTSSSEFLCLGDTFWLGESPITSAGTYLANFTNAQGCDSLNIYTIAFAEYPMLDLPTDTLVPQGTFLNYNISLPPGGSIIEVNRSSFGEIFVDDGTFEIFATEEHETITIQLVADGCEYSYSFQISTVDERCFGDIPNIFSPNGDNINDTWSLDLTDCPANDIKIYDRWGNLVAHMLNDSQPSWDGKFNDQHVADGVYVYVISYTDSSGTAQVLAGDITVLK